MTFLTPRRSRVWWVRSVDVLFWSVAAAVPAALYWHLAPNTLGPWLSIGTPVFFAGLGPLLRGAATQIPELEWDRDRFEYRGAERIQVKWADYRGHRLTWAIPPRLRLFRAGQRPVTIEFFMFDEPQRIALLDELARREAALPNRRLQLPAPASKGSVIS